MKKVFATATLLALVCALLAGTALAEYGYTAVSRIPMAVDFSVSVEFDADGRPQIVTDYPFREAGATEMNLVFNKGPFYEAAVLNYTSSTRITRVCGWNSNIYDSDLVKDIDAAVCRDIRDGVLVMDDTVHIGTSWFDARTDWFLSYSVASKEYTGYTEKTHAQAFNAMAAGGIDKSIWYTMGQIKDSRIIKRIESADLSIYYDAFGNITSADVCQWTGDYVTYDYDPSTGLFSGHTLPELGFDDDDIMMEAPASLADALPEEEKTEVKVTRDPTRYVVGGLISGILIGVILYYSNRRRKHSPEE